MSYLVLARKWRPKTFDDLVGQEPIARMLKNALAQGKISHAYIFSGPRGVGKTTTARILAKALNCMQGPATEPCGICESCTAVTEGSSVDVIEIDGASNNSVDDIRDLRERVKYAPSGGKYKIYIIDEVHMLSGSAFNALLKTLEEPPSHVIFVLATTEMKKIPATVLSRCQHMPFRRIATSVIKARLKHIADSEKISISSHALGLVARAADGSMRDSLTILDQVSSFADEINEEQVQNLLGLTDFGMLTKTAKALITGNRIDIVEIVDSLSEQGFDFRAFAKDLAQFFRDLLIAAVVRQPGEALELSSEELATVRELAAASSEDQLTLMLSEVIKTEADVRNSSLPRIALEMALIRISFLSSLNPVKEIIKNLDSLAKGSSRQTDVRELVKERPAAAPINRAADKSEPEAVEQGEEANEETPLPDSADEGAYEEPLAEVSGPVVPEKVGDITVIWQKVLESIDAPLASKLENSTIELAGNQLHITLQSGQALFVDMIRKSRADIEKILTEHAGKKLSITLSAPAKKKAVPKQDLKNKVSDEPLIKEALELFDGRIIDVIPVESQTTTKNGGADV